MTIEKGNEGIEGLTIEFSGEEIYVAASDDGLNASGGTGMGGFGGLGAVTNCGLVISGGSIHVDAGGDGVDSNGTVLVTGGKTYVSGPANGSACALDPNTPSVITGGIFSAVAAGATQNSRNFGTESTQGSILIFQAHFPGEKEFHSEEF